mmetsp:Transcript_13235/g.22520  ORF Transcript_13235/g.22520 Transcript_13235/m.22520 type:complete len:238 (-) Transcript_13235:43-756(-)
MSTVDGVTALEGNDIDVVGKTLTNLSRGTAREITNREVEAGDLSSHVVLTTLSGNHEGTRVLNGTGSVALEALQWLVGDVLVGELNSGDREVSLLEENSLSGLKILVIGIKNDRKSKDGSVGESHVLDDTLVLGLFHESSERRESTVHDELNIAELTLGCLEDDIGLGNSSFLFFVGLHHEVDQSSSMGLLSGGLKLCVGETESWSESRSNKRRDLTNTGSTKLVCAEGGCRSDEKG